MKVISLKKQARLQHRFEEEKQLDNTFTISTKKAGLLTCLFLWITISLWAQRSQDWLERPELLKAYSQCLNLELDSARQGLKNSTTPEALYILSLADAIELLISEDKSKFEAYEPVYEERIDALKKSVTTDKTLFVLAELRLQWAFVHLKYGNDFSAAWNVRQAHTIVQECSKKFPSFVPIQKTWGVLQVILGTVPEKYQWILNMLGMRGSVETGTSQLKQVEEEDTSLAFEATLLTLLVDGFILQQTDSAVAGIENLHFLHPENRLILFLGASLAIKNSMSEMAMNMLEKLKVLRGPFKIHYADYLLGEVYLHQGNYSKSIQAYQSFIRNYKGENYLKDAYYKIGINYWLSHRSELAAQNFDLARVSGKEASEADKYAARSLAENTLPNIKLSKIRYSTDGGYYDEAFRILKTVQKDELITTKELCEYYYRQARLYHKTNSITEAKNHYLNTIELNANENWYYGPNSCLQLGYIYASENNPNEAIKYFEKALSYKKHEYKNSIDSKAKSGIEQQKAKTNKAAK